MVLGTWELRETLPKSTHYGPESRCGLKRGADRGLLQQPDADGELKVYFDLLERTIGDVHMASKLGFCAESVPRVWSPIAEEYRSGDDPASSIERKQLQLYAALPKYYVRSTKYL